MGFARTNVNTVLLLAGTVFVVGGQEKVEHGSPTVLGRCTTERRQLDGDRANGLPQQYHSVAVLLPDGKS